MAGLAHSVQPIYQLTPAAAELAIVDWDGIHAVYQRPSGETHAFNDVTVAILRCLREGSGTLSAIVKRVATALGAEGDEVLDENFIGVVARLEELGLIERPDAGARSA